MNFLEILICIAIIAILSTMGIFGYQSLLARTRTHADAELIASALNYARTHAVRGFDASIFCDSVQCVARTYEGEKIFNLSGFNEIRTALFPANALGVFTFTHHGVTAFHNGTIYVGETKKVVVSSGGRIKIAAL